MDTVFLNLNVKLFNNALYYITLFLNLVSGQYAAQCVNTCLPVIFTAVALFYFIHRILISKKSQLRIYNDIQLDITIIRIVTKY
jgi:hypothetical protein